MSQMECRGGWDRADLERMSTTALEELLLQGFHARKHGEDGMSRLYQAAQVLAEREPDSGGAADRAWESFQENYLPFVAAHSVLSEDGIPPSSDAAPGRRHSPFRRRGTVLAAAALAVTLLALGTRGRLRSAPDPAASSDREDIRVS